MVTTLVIATALEEATSGYLGSDRHALEGSNQRNFRNGKRSNTIPTDMATIMRTGGRSSSPRDKKGTFAPVIVGKRQCRLSAIDGAVLSLSSRELTSGKASAHFTEVYSASVSKDASTRITDTVLREMVAWWSRPFERVCAAAFIDAINVRFVTSAGLSRAVA